MKAKTRKQKRAQKTLPIKRLGAFHTYLGRNSLLLGLLNSNSDGDGHTDHGVVAIKQIKTTHKKFMIVATFTMRIQY
jgi:hypothetical protein